MKNVIITVLAVLVLGLGGYLVYDKVIKKGETKNINEQAKLEGLFSNINENSFVLLSVGKQDDSKIDGYNYESIESYSKAKELLSKFSKLEYKKYTETGFGYAEYEIKTTYKVDGNEEVLKVRSDGLVLIYPYNNSVEAYEFSDKDKVLNYVKEAYNNKAIDNKQEETNNTITIKN